MMPARSLGFTLIELMITIVILGIVLAIAAPSMSQYIATTRVKGVAENLAQDLVMARSEAIRINTPVQLDIRSACYGLVIGGTACDCTITDIANTNYCSLKKVDTNSDISLNKTIGFNNLIFDPVRGLPVTNTYGGLTATQVLSIENSSAKVNVNLSVIGSVCINSPAGNKKISGYQSAC